MTNLAQHALKLMGILPSDQLGNENSLPLRSTPEGWERGWSIIVRILTQPSPQRMQAPLSEELIAECDKAFMDGDWKSFRNAVQEISATP